MQAQMIEMYKIDPEAIQPIRGVDEDSESFKILNEVIKQDAQKYPILIRRLNDDDRKNRAIKDGAEFGIIDGQHRFRIAQNNNQNEILAAIVEEEVPPMSTRKMEDVKTALRMNTGIPLSIVEKGKIIYEMADGKNVAEIGEELFGIATAMAYRCVQAYKTAYNIETLSKKHKKVINDEKLSALGDVWNKLPHNENEINLEDLNRSVEQVNEIEQMERKLGAMKRIYLSKADIRNEFLRRKQELREQKRAAKNS